MAKKYYFIVNTTSISGKAKEMWQQVEAELEKRGIEYTAYLTEYEGHAKELANKICEGAGAENEVSLVVLGGDGTANEVIDGISNFENVQFGYKADKIVINNFNANFFCFVLY